MNEEQQRLWSLLQDALPNVATQMRGSLSNLYTAAGRLLPPEELEQQPELTQSAAILNQSYYRLLRMVNNLSALAILKEHTPFPTANVELVGWLDELVLQAQPLAEMKGVDLRFSTPVRHHIAAVHREYLERIETETIATAVPALLLAFFEKQKIEITVSTHPATAATSVSTEKMPEITSNTVKSAS